MSNPKVPKDPSAELPNGPSGQSDISSAYVEVRAALMRFASRYLRKKQDIEDVVQEACVRALEAQNKCHIHSPKAYLFRTTKNLALKELAKSAYRLTDTVGVFDDETVITGSTSVEQQYESGQQFELFCRAVRVLPVKCRRVFILRRVYGLSLREIATRLGISEKTVEAHLTKGIVRCTEYMEAEEGIAEKTNAKAKVKRENG